MLAKNCMYLFAMVGLSNLLLWKMNCCVEAHVLIKFKSMRCLWKPRYISEIEKLSDNVLQQN